MVSVSDFLYFSCPCQHDIVLMKKRLGVFYLYFWGLTLNMVCKGLVKSYRTEPKLWHHTHRFPSPYYALVLIT